MAIDVKGKDFITTQDWSVDELEQIFTLAAELKQAKKDGRPTRILDAKTLYMIFFDAALNNILDDIKDDLADFGVHFDKWFSERELEESGAVQHAIRAVCCLAHAGGADGTDAVARSGAGVPGELQGVRPQGR